MLYPYTRSWTLAQKWLIVLLVLASVRAFGEVVYSYERYHRGLRGADLAGTWTRVDRRSAGGYYDLRPDGVMVLLDEEGQPTEFKGKWYAGGDNIYVLVPSDDLANRRLVVWQIVDISKNQFRVRVWQDEDPAVWRRMKPIPRPPVDWSDMPIPEVEVNP